VFNKLIIELTYEYEGVQPNVGQNLASRPM